MPGATSSTSPTVILQIVRAADRGRHVVEAHRGDHDYSDTLDINSARSRGRFISSIREEFDLDEDDSMEQQLLRLLREWNDTPRSNSEERDTTQVPTHVEPDPVTLAVAAAFLENQDLTVELRRDFESIGIVGEWVLALTIYLVAISRLLPKPLSMCVRAASSSGKSFVTEKVLGLMPETAVLKATSISPNALYYLTPGSLRHRIVVLAERYHPTKDRGESANATLYLREMISSGELRKVVTMQSADGGFESVEIVQEGPISLIQTTTQRDVFEEDLNRMIVMATDETRVQTAAILNSKASVAAGAIDPEALQAAVRQKHQAAQSMIRPMRVIIPYAQQIVPPPDRLTARRQLDQVLGIVSSVALLRQFHKPQDGEFLIADLDDYRIAYEVLPHIIGEANSPLSKGARELLEVLREHFAGGLATQFLAANCETYMQLSRTEINKRLAELVDIGAVQVVSSGRGKATVYAMGSPQRVACPSPNLPNPEQLAQVLAAVEN